MAPGTERFMIERGALSNFPFFVKGAEDSLPEVYGLKVPSPSSLGYTIYLSSTLVYTAA
jgi:hypothetical protein